MHAWGAFIWCALSILTIGNAQERLEGLFDYDLYDSLLDEETCARHLDQMNRFEMFDASFRIPSGILQGNLNSFGNYHQCLNIRQEVEDDVIQGKYCLMTIPFSNAVEIGLPNLPSLPEIGNRVSRVRESVLSATGLRNDPADASITDLLFAGYNLGVCIPASCTLSQGLGRLFNNSIITVNYQEGLCRVSGDKPMVAADYVSYTIFAIIGLATLISTSYEVWYLFIAKNEPKKINPLYSSCSVYCNTKKLFEFRSSNASLACLDGIRSLSILWVVIGHTFLTMFVGAIANLLEAVEFGQSMDAIWLTSANISVDTFFMLSGLLLVYAGAPKLTKKSLLTNLHMFYLNRLLRIFPLLAITVVLQISVFHRISDGPNWALEAEMTKRCREVWWAALLHIQNYYNPLEECLSHSWYLAVDTQLYLLSPIVLYWLLNERKRAWSGLAVITLLAFAVTTIYIVIYAFPGNMFFDDGESTYFKLYYVNTLTRAPVFLVGMIYGYALLQMKGKKLNLPKWLVTLLWLSSFFVFTYTILMYYYSNDADFDNQHALNFINIFNRPMWCVALGWLIIACAHGYGGPIAWFLSWKLWQFVAKISFAMYMLHYPMQFVKVFGLTTPLYFSVGTIFKQFFNDFYITICVSMLVWVLVDAPCATFVKLLLQGPRRKPRENKPKVDVEDAKPNDNEKTGL